MYKTRNNTLIQADGSKEMDFYIIESEKYSIFQPIYEQLPEEIKHRSKCFVISASFIDNNKKLEKKYGGYKRIKLFPEPEAGRRFENFLENPIKVETPYKEKIINNIECWKGSGYSNGVDGDGLINSEELDRNPRGGHYYSRALAEMESFMAAFFNGFRSDLAVSLVKVNDDIREELKLKKAIGQLYLLQTTNLRRNNNSSFLELNNSGIDTEKFLFDVGRTDGLNSLAIIRSRYGNLFGDYFNIEGRIRDYLCEHLRIDDGGILDFEIMEWRKFTLGIYKNQYRQDFEKSLLPSSIIFPLLSGLTCYYAYFHETDQVVKLLGSTILGFSLLLNYFNLIELRSLFHIRDLPFVRVGNKQLGTISNILRYGISHSKKISSSIEKYSEGFESVTGIKINENNLKESARKVLEKDVERLFEPKTKYKDYREFIQALGQNSSKSITIH